MVKIIGFILSLCLASCSLMALQEPEVSISDVKVIAIASGDEAEFCRGFTLTRAQVEAYFERAEEGSFSDLNDEYDYLPCVVEGAQREWYFERAEEHSFSDLHDEFDYLPCAVKGAMRRADSQCEFVIRAGATAEVSCESNQQFFYGCRSCDDLFQAHP